MPEFRALGGLRPNQREMAFVQEPLRGSAKKESLRWIPDKAPPRFTFPGKRSCGPPGARSALSRGRSGAAAQEPGIQHRSLLPNRREAALAQEPLRGGAKKESLRWIPDKAPLRST